jgi:hypothetical protein
MLSSIQESSRSTHFIPGPKEQVSPSSTKKVALGIISILGFGLACWYGSSLVTSAIYKKLGERTLSQTMEGSFTKNGQSFPLDLYADEDYLSRWKFSQLGNQSQSFNLCNYVNYQIENQYYNGLASETLQRISPGVRSMTDREVRHWYNRNLQEAVPCLVEGMKKLIPFAPNKMRTGECYDRALAASETRNNLKHDARVRSKETPEKALEVLNALRYGGEIDAAYITGKYLRDTK